MTLKIIVGFEQMLQYAEGVTIGKNSVIGVGIVVLHDITKNTVAAGNPCKITRQID